MSFSCHLDLSIENKNEISLPPKREMTMIRYI